MVNTNDEKQVYIDGKPLSINIKTEWVEVVEYASLLLESPGVVDSCSVSEVIDDLAANVDLYNKVESRKCSRSGRDSKSAVGKLVIVSVSDTVPEVAEALEKIKSKCDRYGITYTILDSVESSLE